MSIILKNINFSYDKNSNEKALKEINITINKGDFVGICGKTGSGKTTLARVMSNLITPDSGIIDNKIGKVGMVFQFPEYQLFEETVLKDVMFGPLNLGLSNEEAKQKAKEAMNLVGLSENFENRSPFELSGGEKRRASIAGILSMEPDLIILDEPASGLDNLSHDLVFSLLKDLNSKGKTIVVISHYINDLAQYCNRVFEMDEGIINEIEKPKTELEILLEKIQHLNGGKNA